MGSLFRQEKGSEEKREGESERLTGLSEQMQGELWLATARQQLEDPHSDDGLIANLHRQLDAREEGTWCLVEYSSAKVRFTFRVRKEPGDLPEVDWIAKVLVQETERIILILHRRQKERLILSGRWILALSSGLAERSVSLEAIVV